MRMRTRMTRMMRRIRRMWPRPNPTRVESTYGQNPQLAAGRAPAGEVAVMRVGRVAVDVVVCLGGRQRGEPHATSPRS
jgi:hypothetical protein